MRNGQVISHLTLLDEDAEVRIVINGDEVFSSIVSIKDNGTGDAIEITVE